MDAGQSVRPSPPKLPTYPYARLTMDAAGSLYGTTSYFIGPLNYSRDGDAGQGSDVFKLAFSNSTWTYVDLHEFTGRNGDGGGPTGSTSSWTPMATHMEQRVRAALCCFAAEVAA